MKLVITGSKGQLGTELQRQLSYGGSILGRLPAAFTHAEICAVDVDDLNICDESKVQQFLTQIHPDIVIHCAAMTNVDSCEDNEQQAQRTNGTAVKYLAKVCETICAKLILLSTDYVFAGTKQTPYTEQDLCDPQSVYGRSKLLGEQYALRYCSHTFVVRTAWLYGRHGHNFVKTILNKAREQTNLHVVNDQIGCPTNAEDLAHHLFKLAITEQYGIYHCVGNGACSWYEFASEIISCAGISCQIFPCTSQEYPQNAKRPAYSVLAQGALEKAVGNQMRPWKEALHDYMSKLGEWT